MDRRDDEAARTWTGWRSSRRRRVEGDFTLVHGSPRDPIWEYLFSVPAARINLAAFETPYCLVGHTHHQLTFRDDDGQVEALPARDGDRLTLDVRRCILNPGSVGQPRDGDPRACAMTIDTETAEVEWLRFDYDIERDAGRHPGDAAAGPAGRPAGAGGLGRR